MHFSHSFREPIGFDLMTCFRSALLNITSSVWVLVPHTFREPVKQFYNFSCLSCHVDEISLSASHRCNWFLVPEKRGKFLKKGRLARQVIVQNAKKVQDIDTWVVWWCI